MTHNKNEIEKLVKEFGRVEAALLDAARSSKPYQFTPAECPLSHDHYGLSEQIFGTGCWGWTCGFCGAEFEE